MKPKAHFRRDSFALRTGHFIALMNSLCRLLLIVLIISTRRRLVLTSDLAAGYTIYTLGLPLYSKEADLSE